MVISSGSFHGHFSSHGRRQHRQNRAGSSFRGRPSASNRHRAGSSGTGQTVLSDEYFLPRQSSIFAASPLSVETVPDRPDRQRQTDRTRQRPIRTETRTSPSPIIPPLDSMRYIMRAQHGSSSHFLLHACHVWPLQRLLCDLPLLVHYSSRLTLIPSGSLITLAAACSGSIPHIPFYYLFFFAFSDYTSLFNIVSALRFCLPRLCVRDTALRARARASLSRGVGYAISTVACLLFFASFPCHPRYHPTRRRAHAYFCRAFARARAPRVYLLLITPRARRLVAYRRCLLFVFMTPFCFLRLFALLRAARLFAFCCTRVCRIAYHLRAAFALHVLCIFVR